jgi:hypothetical protein
MSDDLKTAKTALAKLHLDIEAINKLAKPSYLSVVEQMAVPFVFWPKSFTLLPNRIIKANPR